ncbi:cytokinesis regulator [Aspergillus costaricaensis CBS 115574]|uniref:Cytokinesis regulator n=1 Tax=Aspergillus costaricaensis CBS 115574 TaxID=1448317 RepID=A0ACD1IW70_9EURO|nr:cytokinesis regulator [Aspergillus costaricaensis CBS 115574]RAK94592.1 cytokinesis regulator [Aspergillus costaricaensis CBS 115574]
MAPFTLEVRHSEEETIECWDDDDDLQCYEDIQLRAASTATSVTTSSVRRSGHRDSISSRRSGRSDIDSNAGGDEDWQVQLLDNDEIITEEAIASAKNAGIPLPMNVPRSALIGGTIKRLGHRKQKKDIVDDWSDDVEFPGPDGTLELKRSLNMCFPESLRQINSAAPSPTKTSAPGFWDSEVSTRLQSALAITSISPQEGELVDTQDVPTIRVAKPRSPDRATRIDSPTPERGQDSTDNLEDDFELPADDILLRLSPRKTAVETAGPTPDDIDVDWSEGSIGVRFGGTARDQPSIPSSSVSVVSPSSSSCLTVESEDEGLDGLVIPEGPLDFEASLRKRKESPSDDVRLERRSVNQTPVLTDDFFSGLEVNNGEVFNPRRLSINPNVKCKTEIPKSPARHSTTTITFTNTAVSPKTRIPRLSGHDRPHSTHLETVSESGAPLSRFRSSQRRAGGHSSQSSVSSLPGSSTSQIPSTPSRRLIGAGVSNDSFASERITSGRQLLRTKRSMPTLRNTHQTISNIQSLPTLQDGSDVPKYYATRPKTPVDRIGSDTKTFARKPQAPFLPAGASDKQSHHASVKSSRYNRRSSSDSPNDASNPQGHGTRLPRSTRHDTMGKTLNESSPEALVAASKRTLTRPTRRRNFGDGSELALFDDLPTSSSAERKFVKHPSGRGVPRTLRSKLNHGQSNTAKADATIEQATPSATIRLNSVTPRFARDTNASRNAREQRIASLTNTPKNRDNHPLAPLGMNWKPANVSRVPSNSATIRSRKSKAAPVPVSKPQLIKPMGTGVQEPKSLNGMRYNPSSFCWEGNENIVQDFDTMSPKSPKPTPALITNIGAMKNVQVVGGMVFDPQRMCWLKLAPLQPGKDGLVAIQDEDDVFAGLDDLKEPSNTAGGRISGAYDEFGLAASIDDRSYEDSSDEWPITEEFDVGPEFIRRQRAEEEKWRRKVDKWTTHDRGRFGDGWRWAIRDLVRFNNSTLSTQHLDRT